MSKDRVARLRELVGSLPEMRLDEIAELVAEDDLYSHVAAQAVRSAIRRDLAADNGEGIPWALSVDNHGTYRQTAFFDAEEYRFAIRGYLRRAKANDEIAYRLAHQCEAVLGVWIDPESEREAL